MVSVLQSHQDLEGTAFLEKSFHSILEVEINIFTKKRRGEKKPDTSQEATKQRVKLEQKSAGF